MAPGTVWTSSAIALISWIVPSTLLVCVQATSLVCSESRGRRFSGVRVKPLDGVHHLTVRLWDLAARSHGEMLAS